MTVAEMNSARCTQAEFGRLVGLSAMRITQLVRVGLLEVDASGVKLLDSLRRFYEWRTVKKYRGWTLEDYQRAQKYWR